MRTKTRSCAVQGIIGSLGEMSIIQDHSFLSPVKNISHVPRKNINIDKYFYTVYRQLQDRIHSGREMEQEGIDKEYHVVIQEYTNSLSQSLYQLQQKGILCDTGMLCKDGIVPIHRLILVANKCTSLERHLTTLKSKQSQLQLVGFSRGSVCDLVQGLYTGQFTLHRSRAGELLALCSHLGINAFMCALVTVMNNNPSLKQNISLLNTLEEDVNGGGTCIEMKSMDEQKTEPFNMMVSEETLYTDNSDLIENNTNCIPNPQKHLELNATVGKASATDMTENLQAFIDKAVAKNEASDSSQQASCVFIQVTESQDNIPYSFTDDSESENQMDFSTKEPELHVHVNEINQLESLKQELEVQGPGDLQCDKKFLMMEGDSAVIQTSSECLNHQEISSQNKEKDTENTSQQITLNDTDHSNGSSTLDHTIVPANLEHTIVPANLDHTTVPANLDHTIVPANLEHTIVPANLDHTTVPTNLDHTTVPANPDHTTVHANLDHTNVPANPDHTNVPANPDHTTVPANADHTIVSSNLDHTIVPTSLDHIIKVSEESSGNQSVTGTRRRSARGDKNRLKKQHSNSTAGEPADSIQEGNDKNCSANPDNTPKNEVGRRVSPRKHKGQKESSDNQKGKQRKTEPSDDQKGKRTKTESSDNQKGKQRKTEPSNDKKGKQTKIESSDNQKGRKRKGQDYTDKPYKCDQCSKSFLSHGSLKQHKVDHSGFKQFECHICYRGFSRNLHLLRHMETHATEKPYKCDLCSKNFAEVDNLNLHTKKVHGIDENAGCKSNVCEICGKTFKKKSTLLKHRDGHTSGRRFMCHVCSKSFLSKGDLNRHINTHLDENEKPYHCEICGKGFSVKVGLETHIDMAHTGYKPFKCEQCGLAFVKKGRLNSHVKTHLGEKPHKCELCGERFTAKTSLSLHLKLHAGDKPFACEECGKSFVTKSKLQEHLKRHTGERPCICEVCGKGFTNSSNLRVHTRRHLGIKPYPCSSCGKSFYKKDNLRRHAHSVHDLLIV